MAVLPQRAEVRLSDRQPKRGAIHSWTLPQPSAAATAPTAPLLGLGQESKP